MNNMNSNNEIKCGQCGQMLDSSKKFCHGCGNDIVEPTKNDKRVRRNFYNILILFLIVIAAGFYVTVISQTEESPSEFSHAEEGGMPDMEQMIANLPKDYSGLVQSGNRFMDRGLYSLAIESYSRAVAIDSTDPNVVTDLGICHFAINNVDKALEFFKKAVRLQPRHAIAHFFLGYAHLDINNPDSARMYWERFLEFHPRHELADTVKKYINQIGQ